MAFWGVEVKPGKVTPFVPPPEGSKLHLSQAALGVSAPAGAKAALYVKVGDGSPLVVCRLREGSAESASLDLIFDAYAEFSVEGKAAVHLTGYYMPEYEMEEEEEEEGPLGQILGYDEYGVPILADEYDSEEDSDYESESDEGDEPLMLEAGDEEDSSEEEGGSSDDDLAQLGRGRRVVIEEIKDEEPAAKKEGKQQKAAAANGKAANGKAAQFDDSDVSASDEEDSEDEEGSEDEDEDESSDDEEAPAAAKQQPKQAQQQQQAGQKRKAEEVPASSKKQAVEAQKGGKPAAAAATPAAAQKQQQQQKQQPKSEQKGKQQQQDKTPAKTPAKTPGKDESLAANEVPSSNKKVRRFANGFEIEEVKMGRPDGKLAKPGKKVVVKYLGRLKSNGKVFDQTKGNATFSFRLGVGEVIKGWDKGVEGMRVGDKRKLLIPPQMAYGSSGVRGAIPPNATLQFDVELVDVK